MLGGAFCLAVTVRSGNQCSASRPDLPLDLQPTRAYPEPRWVLADGISYARERHLFDILLEYSHYFDQGRTHQGIGQLVPAGCSTAAAGRGPVMARTVLNGLHHDYRRAA